MRIFLSYVQADREFARKLASRLEAEGFDTWDRARDIFPGDNWALRAGEALEAADAVVVVVSPDSVKSEMVQREIQFALGDPKKDGRVFPVVARPTVNLPWVLKLFRVLDASRGLGEVTKRIVVALPLTKAQKARARKALKSVAAYGTARRGR